MEIKAVCEVIFILQAQWGYKLHFNAFYSFWRWIPERNVFYGFVLFQYFGLAVINDVVVLLYFLQEKFPVPLFIFRSYPYLAQELFYTNYHNFLLKT